MRVYFFCFAFLSMLVSCSRPVQQNKPSLVMDVSNLPAGNNLVLYLYGEVTIPVDTAIINANGHYEFQRKVRQTNFYLIKFPGQQILTLILHPDETPFIRVDAGNVLSSANISDNQDCNNIISAERISEEFGKRLEEFVPELTREKLKKSVKDSLIGYIDTIKSVYRDRLIDILQRDSTSLSVLPVLMQQCGNHSMFDPVSDRQYFVKADTFLTRHYGYIDLVMQFHYQLDSLWCDTDTLRNVRVGDVLPEPGFKTTWHQKLPLRTFWGKPVLMVFWKPEAPENRWLIPEIKEYLPYHQKKQMAVYMVAADTSEARWNLAIDVNRLACWQLGDMKGPGSKRFFDLGIRTFPSVVLLNRHGVIVSKNVWGKQLKSDIEKQLNN